MLMISIFIFIFGLCIGSFLNVLIYRLPRSLSIGGRSFCPHCKEKINWYDNIPLLSFVLLKGKCRHCHSPIGWRYPIVEILTGFLFLGVIGGIRETGVIGVLGYLVIVSAMVAVFFIDLEHQIIPDELIFLSVIVFFISNYQLAINNFFVAVITGLFFLALHVFTKGQGMGMGDVKLAFLMGLVLGFPGIVFALYLAFLTGAIIGIILIIIGKKRFGQQIAFGPYLVAANLVFIFFKDQINQWLTAYIF